MVTARWWNDQLAKQFGPGGRWSDMGPGGVPKHPGGPIAELPDDTSTFLEVIAPHGRFSIDLSKNLPHLHFENDYD